MGDGPSHAEYASRFPAHGDVLRDELERVDAELSAEDESSDDEDSTVSLPVLPSIPGYESPGISGAGHGYCLKARRSGSTVRSPSR